MKLKYIIICGFCVSFCVPINSKFIDRYSFRKLENFTNNRTFQVKCSENIFKYPEKPKRREVLLDKCRTRLVTRLAEFKIAYDLNLQNVKFQSKITYPQLATRNSSKISLDVLPDKKNALIIADNSRKISNLDQIVIEWNEEKKKQLLDHYKEYLPGRIIYEWIEDDRENFIYSIQRNSLMEEIKNTSLPFGVEIQ